MLSPWLIFLCAIRWNILVKHDSLWKEFSGIIKSIVDKSFCDLFAYERGLIYADEEYSFSINQTKTLTRLLWVPKYNSPLVSCAYAFIVVTIFYLRISLLCHILYNFMNKHGCALEFGHHIQCTTMYVLIQKHNDLLVAPESWCNYIEYDIVMIPRQRRCCNVFNKIDM